MSHRFLRLGPIILLLVLLATGCSGTTGTAPENGTDTTAVAAPDNPLDGFVTVAANVRLHYLDFGGTGEPLLLLAGFGNTANVFRTFAPLLTDDFRVRALTRRGFGQSSQPASGYDRVTLAEDIRILLDSLDVSTVHLVGHSLAGDEMTRFAVNYPGRLGKLVYLDAAYDRAVMLDSTPEWAVPPAPVATDLSSRTAYGAYLAQILGVAFPEAEIAATTRAASDGSVTGLVTPSWVGQAINDGVEAPDYAGVIAPALGIYAVVQSAADAAPWLTPSSPDWTAAETYVTTVLAPAHEADRTRFDTEVPNSTVLELGGANHYVFLWDLQQVATAVLDFLRAP